MRRLLDYFDTETKAQTLKSVCTGIFGSQFKLNRTAAHRE